jgi:hypothetical protein
MTRARNIPPRIEEWDFPPVRGRYRAYPRDYDVYRQPSGWDSPVVKKAIDIYLQVMIGIIKVIFISALTIMAFGASWLIVTVLTL